MIFIANSNILFSGLVKDGLTRQFLVNSPFTLYAPETMVSEIRKYERIIPDKSGLSKDDFETLFSLLIENITIASKEEYQSKIREADRIIGHIDRKDVPFLALALSIPNDGIWSDDEHFQKQSKIRTWTAAELIRKFLTE